MLEELCLSGEHLGGGVGFRAVDKPLPSTPGTWSWGRTLPIKRCGVFLPGPRGGGELLLQSRSLSKKILKLGF